MPTVSVVIPTYNRASVLSRAIESVLAQTYDDFELVVVDDCSTDGTEAVVASFTDPRITYRSHATNQGGNAARATGIEAATGEYVAFLDSDDEWRPDKLDAQVTRAHETGAGVVYSGIRNIGLDGRTNGVQTPTLEGDLTRALLFENFIGSFSTVLADQEVIEATGPPDPEFASWQDWEYYIRLSKHATFAVVPEPLIGKHTDDSNRISADFETKLTETYPRFREKFADDAAREGRWFGRCWRGRLLGRLGYAALHHERYPLARRLLARSLWYDPTHTRTYGYLLAALGGPRIHQSMRALKRWVIRTLETRGS